MSCSFRRECCPEDTNRPTASFQKKHPQLQALQSQDLVEESSITITHATQTSAQGLGLQALQEKLDSLGFHIQSRFDHIALELSLLKAKIHATRHQNASAALGDLDTLFSNVDGLPEALKEIMDALKESILVQRETQEMVKEADRSTLTQLSNNTQCLEQMKDKLPMYQSFAADKPPNFQIASVPIPPDDVMSFRSGTRSTVSFLSSDAMDTNVLRTPTGAGPEISKQSTLSDFPQTPSKAPSPNQSPRSPDHISSKQISLSFPPESPSGGLDTDSMVSILPQSASARTSDESAGSSWYVGAWIDKSGSFFNGTVISVTKDGWEPRVQRRGEHKFSQKTTYSMVADQKDNSVSLIEHRVDGQLRTFKAICGPSIEGVSGMNTMIVSFQGVSGKPLIWTLTAHSETWPQGESLTLASYRQRKLQLKKQLEEKASVFEQVEHAFSSRSNITLFSIEQKLVEHYEHLMVFTVCISLIGLGMQVEFSTPDHPATVEVDTALESLEAVCLAIFFMDFGIQIWATHWKCLRTFSFHFDMSTIVIGALCFALKRTTSKSDPFYVVCRCLRFLRAGRILKAMDVEAPVKEIAQLVAQAWMIISTAAAALLITYIFACWGVELITNSSGLRYRSDADTLNLHRFGGVYASLLTLILEFIAPMDQDIFGPLMIAAPWLIFYFLILFTVLPISLMRVAFAVVTESAMEAVRRSREEHEEKLNLCKSDILNEVPLYEDYFESIDKQDKSVLQKPEFTCLDPTTLPAQVQECLSKFQFDSIGEFFDVLDTSVSGMLTKNQFVAGMLKMRVAQLRDVPTEILLLLMHSRVSGKRSKETARIIFNIHAQVTQLSAFTMPPMSLDTVTSIDATPREVNAVPQRIWR